VIKSAEGKKAMAAIASSFNSLGFRQRFAAYKTYASAVNVVCAYDADVMLRNQAIEMASSRMSTLYRRSAHDTPEYTNLSALKVTNNIQREFSTSALVYLGLRFERCKVIQPTPEQKITLDDGRSTISADLDAVETVQLITDRADKHTRTATSSSA